VTKTSPVLYIIATLIIFLLVYLLVSYQFVNLGKTDPECVRPSCSEQGCVLKSEYEKNPWDTTCEYRPIYGCQSRYTNCLYDGKSKCNIKESIAYKICKLTNKE
jgi:hypothetical protein